jgi:transposase
LFYASRDRSGDHPERHLKQFTGILQADAYAGYNRLYLPDRQPGPVTEALCWSHARRKFFVLADIAANTRRGRNATPISPIAFEAVRRIDALFDIERDINGLAAGQRLAVRKEKSAPLVAELGAWMRSERGKLSRHAPTAQAIDYMLKRWDGFIRFLDDGRVCLTNNAAERALRGLALGRKAWLFAGSERGAERAALMYTLIGTAKLNDVDPQAWLANVLARIADTPLSRLAELLPWNWAAKREPLMGAA